MREIEIELHEASANNNILAVEILLKNKDIDVNLSNILGLTPLTHASKSGYKEIVELFVVKRPDPNDSSNLLTKELKQKHKIEKKKRKEQEKLEKKKDPKAYKEKKKKEKMKNRDEYWCLYFVTRNAKTKKIDDPRIIEAKITYIKINKKQTDRVIKSSDNLNFKKEWEWIKPIKEKEDEAKLKNEKIQQKKNRKRKYKKTKTKRKTKK